MSVSAATMSVGSDDLTTPVRPAHRLDEETLRRFLDGKIDGVEDRFEIRQFAGGQSNPTYLITTSRAVLCSAKSRRGRSCRRPMRSNASIVSWRLWRRPMCRFRGCICCVRIRISWAHRFRHELRTGPR